MTSIGPIKWISEVEIRSALSWDVLVPAISKLLHDAVSSRHDVIQPLRARLYDQDTHGTVLAMPGLVKSQNALATKILSMYPGNAASGLSTHSALVLLNDSDTGLPLALLDGCSITELRTAAASAAATLAVRKSSDNEPVVAVLGAGTQGAAHARVMHHVLKPSQIRLWSRNGSAKLCEVLKSEGIPVISCDSIKDALEGASVINTCTLAQKPIVKKEWVKEGAHINSVGAARNDWQELEADLVLSAAIYADNMEAALSEAGDVIVSGAKITGEIGEVISGNLEVPENKMTIFKSLGMAAEDAVAAKLVYDIIYK